MKKPVLLSEIIFIIILLSSCKKDPLTPTVRTLGVHTITTNSAILRGIIESDGGAAVTECGICWNTSENPTTGDNKITETGKLSYENKISTLSPGITYFARAYAINKAGTSYGESVSFTTQDFELIQSTDFPGLPRFKPLSFTCNGKGYYGLGISPDNNRMFLKDFWCFDPITSSWTRLKDCPFEFDFTLTMNLYSSKCVVGSTVYLPQDRNLYTYDVTSDKWELALRPEFSLYHTNFFSVNDKVYLFRVGFPMLYELVPGSNTFMKKNAAINDFGCAELNEIFVINNEAYMLNKAYEKIEIYHYLSQSDTWEKKLEKKFTSVEFRNASFIIILDNCAFIGQSTSFTNTGTLENPIISPDSPSSNIWKYDCLKNEFTISASMPGVLRTMAGCFSFTGKAFIVGGQTIDPTTRKFSPLKDTWIMTR